jgi:2'-5' RNA ligase
MRLFVCTWLGPDNQAFYERRMDQLIDSSRGALRPIPKDSAHITYAFVAQVDDGALETIVNTLAAVSARHAPIEIIFGPPAILFAGVEARLVLAPITDGADAVTTLASGIVDELLRALPAVEISGSKSAHVTLARFRKHTRRGAVRGLSKRLAEGAPGDPPRTDRIAALHLVSSELMPTGPRYTTLSSVPLGRGEQ